MGNLYVTHYTTYKTSNSNISNDKSSLRLSALYFAVQQDKINFNTVDFSHIIITSAPGNIFGLVKDTFFTRIYNALEIQRFIRNFSFLWPS